MRNVSLHAILEAFTRDAARRLAAEADAGAEVEFELVAERGGSAPLYCYRPLTARFIGERLGVLSALTTYAPAARALMALDGVGRYLSARGEPRVPDDPRARADLALGRFLARIFAERSRFGYEPERFEAAYAELELALYEDRRTTTVIAPLFGAALDHGTRELTLGPGLALVRAEALEGAPREAVWSGQSEPPLLATLTATEEGASPPPGAAAADFRTILTALRLFERGEYALGPLAWARTDGGTWQPHGLAGAGGRPRSLTFIGRAQEDEFRAFFNLVSRRAPMAGEVAWALARFEMGCERRAPHDALTDYLLALRALLEPEGPGSGRLGGRLAAVCAQPEDRAAMSERVAQAAALEAAIVRGIEPRPGPDALVGELAEHLRAILRDVICGHLEPDVCGLADELLAEAAEVA